MNEYVSCVRFMAQQSQREQKRYPVRMEMETTRLSEVRTQMGDIRSAYRLAKRGRWRSQRQTGEVVAVVDSLISDCEQMCQVIISQHRLTGRKKQRIRAQVKEMCKRLSLNEFRWRQEMSK